MDTGGIPLQSLAQGRSLIRERAYIIGCDAGVGRDRRQRYCSTNVAGGPGRRGAWHANPVCFANWTITGWPPSGGQELGRCVPALFWKYAPLFLSLELLSPVFFIPADTKSMKKAVFSLFLVLVFSALPVTAEEFYYKHETGSKYRILSVVDEDVYINRRFSHKARILNRSAVEIGEVRGDRAEYRAVFQTAEQILEGKGSRSFQWAMEYDSVFEQDRLGHVTIDDRYYMPVVRNVPAFPQRDLKKGESWTEEGHEMHDFRQAFGIEEPYRIPFDAHYVFLGEREWKGKNHPAFSVSYRIFYEPPPVRGKVWPRRITGASDQVVYWDTVMGQASAYHETFRIVLELSNGSTVEYRGKAEAEIIESEIMKKEEFAGVIAGEIEKLGINGASVRIDSQGITISLENIQFQPESYELAESEKVKLDKIGEILLKYADRDILVGGHTALSGTSEGRQRLSLERASAVSDYLILKKIRDPSRVVVRGYGADKPVSDNKTEEGMRKNRRVEITILEN